MFHSNYLPILHCFWDIARYYSKIADLNFPHIYLGSPLGVTHLEFRRDLWHRQTRVSALSYGVVCVILLFVLSLKLLSPVISLPSYALSTGSESLNASNTSSSHLSTRFSQLPNLYRFIYSSLFNFLAVLALHTSYVVTLARPPTSSSLKITDHSFCYALPCLWNQLLLSLRQLYSGISSSISNWLIPSPITSSSTDSPRCSSMTPSLFHCRLHKSYPHSFTSSSRMDFGRNRFFWANRFLFLVFPNFSYMCRELD